MSKDFTSGKTNNHNDFFVLQEMHQGLLPSSGPCTEL